MDEDLSDSRFETLNLDIDLACPDHGWADLLPDLQATIMPAVTECFNQLWDHFTTQQLDRHFEISLVLSDNETVQQLNAEYRQKDKPTNVLSFPGMAPDDPIIPGQPTLLGDIILARETVLAESQQQQKPFEHHFQHLLVHGTLHLLGYDHIDDHDADIMEQLEISILQKLSIPNPYLIKE